MELSATIKAQLTLLPLISNKVCYHFWCVFSACLLHLHKDWQQLSKLLDMCKTACFLERFVYQLGSFIASSDISFPPDVGFLSLFPLNPVHSFWTFINPSTNVKQVKFGRPALPIIYCQLFFNFNCWILRASPASTLLPIAAHDSADAQPLLISSHPTFPCRSVSKQQLWSIEEA